MFYSVHLSLWWMWKGVRFYKGAQIWHNTVKISNLADLLTVRWEIFHIWYIFKKINYLLIIYNQVIIIKSCSLSLSFFCNLLILYLNNALIKTWWITFMKEILCSIILKVAKCLKEYASISVTSILQSSITQITAKLQHTLTAHLAQFTSTVLVFWCPVLVITHGYSWTWCHKSLDNLMKMIR